MAGLQKSQIRYATIKKNKKLLEFGAPETSAVHEPA